MSVIQREKALYEEVWGLEDYHRYSPGEGFVKYFMEMAKIDSGRARMLTVLDAGCGSGKGALALSNIGFSVYMTDVTDDGLIPEARTLPFNPGCLWERLSAEQIGYQIGGKVDYVYCCDVMEHIPTEFTMLVARRLLDVARHGVFFSISHIQDQFGMFVGESLHKTIQSFVWWRNNLEAIGAVVECRDLMKQGLFYVVPR